MTVWDVFLIAAFVFFLAALLTSSKREAEGGWFSAVLKSYRTRWTRLMAVAMASWAAALILAMTHESRILDWVAGS